VMTLVEQRRLALDDAVATHLPAFADGGADRRAVTVRHLLAHTSGLPDMLPDNLELRRRHAPLADFVAGACKAPLAFSPGTRVRYQSMGVLLAAEIARRIARTPFPELLRRRLFAPLGMRRTSLGLGGRRLEETARCQVPDEPWGWNSRYWRELGAPWAGAIGTAGDLARLLRFFARPERGPLAAATARLMLTAQTPPGRERYGLGWRLGAPARGASERTFGHSGATGTVCWMDPERDLTFVLLTTRPAAEAGALLPPVADLVSSAF
jgi:CubicO group peptidase (beta-lactamase class C family)